jgi:CelD/BcsL family acetyltransferase involved in cellulose biosynthesis
MKPTSYEFSSINFGVEWEKFVASRPNATIFHHPAWLNTIARVYGYKTTGFVLRDSGGEICAALPIAFVDSLLTGRRWVAYPFSDYCFPLYRSETELNLLIESLIRFCAESQIDPLEIRWNFPQQTQLLVRPEAMLHLLKLDSNLDRVAAKIHPKQRSQIRQAEKNGVQVEWGQSTQDLKTFYRLHLTTRRRKGVPVQPWKFFELLGKNVIETGHGFVLLAYHQEQCIAGAVFLFQNKTVTYKYSASNQDQLNLRPNNLILWKAIKWSCENGYTLFDFGKTDLENTGLRDFKSRWGAEEQALIYSSISSKPIQNKTGGVNSVVEKIIKISPLWVCRLAGELLYRHFA